MEYECTTHMVRATSAMALPYHHRTPQDETCEWREIQNHGAAAIGAVTKAAFERQVSQAEMLAAFSAEEQAEIIILLATYPRARLGVVPSLWAVTTVGVYVPSTNVQDASVILWVSETADPHLAAQCEHGGR